MSRESFLYKTYGLKGLPFARRVPREVQLEAWVNQEKAVKRWNRILEVSATATDTNFIALIMGDYGMGKTLSLLKIIEDSKKFDKFYSIFTSLTSEQRPSNPSLEFLFRIFREIEFDVINIKKDDLKIFQRDYNEVKKIFNIILFEEDEYLKELALAYLKGEISPTQTQLKHLSIFRKINHIDIAKKYLIGILFLLKKSGFKTLLITVDEFEYLFSIVAKTRQSEILALLRGLYDIFVHAPPYFRDNLVNMVFFLAISEDGLRRLVELENIEESTGGPIQPLRRRFSDIIGLKALSKKDTTQLITKRLAFNRVRGKYEDQPLIPFNERFVDFIFKTSGGKPGEIIVRCDHVLDIGLEKEIKLLTDSFAKEVFDIRGIIY